MKRILIITGLMLTFTAQHLFAQSMPTESWTGGFTIDGRWFAVNVRFTGPNENRSGTTDFISPSFGGGENAINVQLANMKHSPDGGLHFEIPVRSGSIVFDGKQSDRSISGKVVYDTRITEFGLSPWASVTLADLEKLYGAYRVAPDRVISVFRGWGFTRTLNYVDYKTGRVGTLWPLSTSEFYGGDGLAKSFPATVKVTFERDASGTGLKWQSKTEPSLTAHRIAIREERITAKNGDITLGATLLLPVGDRRVPVVIVTPGDYGTNRNQLRMWAHNYVSNGFAALIFDSRGTGESTGPVNSSSFSDLANDVLALVQTLKTRDEIDPKRIGLFGFSNSCFTVTLAASRSKDVSFLILQSFVGVVPWKQESFRAETQLRVDGFDRNKVKQGSDFMKMKYEVARTGNGWDELQATMNRSRGERWLAYTSPPNSLARLRSVYESIMTYDPISPVKKLNIPILALWGDKDTYLPVPETLAAFKTAMAKAGNKNYIIKVYPNGNHSLLESANGSPSTGGTERNFVRDLWKMQANWLRKNAR